MVSTIDICNRALSPVWTRSTIASLTEASAEAQLCSLHYNNTRMSIMADGTIHENVHWVYGRWFRLGYCGGYIQIEEPKWWMTLPEPPAKP